MRRLRSHCSMCLPLTIGLLFLPPYIGSSSTAAASITITTSPAGLQISVDGTTYTAPRTFSWGEGTQHTLSVPSPQASGGTRRLFGSWSDGGTQTHSITVGSADETYTAAFVTQFLLTTAVAPAGGGSILLAPSSADGYYDAGTAVRLTANASPGNGFTVWSGSASGVANPTTITMSGVRSVTANFGPGVRITIGTNPPGLQIGVDGAPYTAPQTFSWGTGIQHTLSAPSPQGSGGTRWVLDSWSDGMAQTHSITVGSTDWTYSAAFVTQHLLTTIASPETGGAIARSPSSLDGYYNAGTTVQLSAVPAPEYAFSVWTGDAVGSTNPTMVILSAATTVTARFSRTSGIGESSRRPPETFGVSPNYPNPFNPMTTIRYELPRSAEVRLSVYDVCGEEVSVLVNERREAGVHEILFDGSSLAGGVYVYRLKAGGSVQSRKCVLLK